MGPEVKVYVRVVEWSIVLCEASELFSFQPQLLVPSLRRRIRRCKTQVARDGSMQSITQAERVGCSESAGIA